MIDMVDLKVCTTFLWFSVWHTISALYNLGTFYLFLNSIWTDDKKKKELSDAIQKTEVLIESHASSIHYFMNMISLGLNQLYEERYTSSTSSTALSSLSTTQLSKISDSLYHFDIYKKHIYDHIKTMCSSSYNTYLKNAETKYNIEYPSPQTTIYHIFSNTAGRMTYLQNEHQQSVEYIQLSIDSSDLEGMLIKENIEEQKHIQ